MYAYMYRYYSLIITLNLILSLIILPLCGGREMGLKGF